MSWRRWVVPVLTGALTGAATVGLTATAGVLISRAALRPDNFLSLIGLATAVRAWGVARAGGRYAERITGHAAALALGARQRLVLFDRITLLGENSQRLGDLLGRVHTDVDAEVMHVVRVTVPAVAVGVVLGGFAAWVAWLDAPLAAVVLIPALLFSGAVLVATRRVSVLAEAELAGTREHASALLDALAASADGAGTLLRRQLSRSAAAVDAARIELDRIGGRLALLKEVLLALCVLALCLVGWRAMTGPEALQPALVVGACLGVVALFELLSVIAGIPAAVEQRRSSSRRAAELNVLQPSMPAPAQPTELPDSPTTIDLYSAGVELSGRSVLRDVSLSVAPGERVVIRGPSGAGKTTLLKLIARRLPSTTGTLAYNGVPADQVTPRAVQSRIAMHLQDAPVLDASIEENLRIGAQNAPMSTLNSMLADLALPKALDDPVGEDGALLSGGERARVSLARTLLSGAAVLLLDEPTAHLDPDTEQTVLDAIDVHTRGRTVIMVSHREGPVRLADRVLTLRDGVLR